MRNETIRDIIQASAFVVILSVVAFVAGFMIDRAWDPKDANNHRTPEAPQAQVGEHWQDLIIALSKRTADLLTRVETLERRVATLTEERDRPLFSPPPPPNLLPYGGWIETNTLFLPSRSFTNSDIDWGHFEGTIILAP